MKGVLSGSLLMEGTARGGRLSSLLAKKSSTIGNVADVSLSGALMAGICHFLAYYLTESAKWADCKEMADLAIPQNPLLRNA